MWLAEGIESFDGKIGMILEGDFQIKLQIEVGFVILIFHSTIFFFGVIDDFSKPGKETILFLFIRNMCTVEGERILFPGDFYLIDLFDGRRASFPKVDRENLALIEIHVVTEVQRTVRKADPGPSDRVGRNWFRRRKAPALS